MMRIFQHLRMANPEPESWLAMQPPAPNLPSPEKNKTKEGREKTK